MQKTLQVEGMTCEHCESAVKGALKQLNGVSHVEVHLTTGKVDVTYDESTVKENTLREAIEEQGYDVL